MKTELRTLRQYAQPSIARGDRMNSLSLGSLFSGTGALDIAAEQVFGVSPAWFCEYDQGPSKILAHHWPSVPNYGDVTAIDWASVPAIDVLTAGYPCQPFSLSGSRKGQSDVRHLWPHVAAAVRHLRPRYVLLENVRGHLSLGFGDVLGDLAGLGYDAQWCVIRASSAGAPHRRERVFILAEDTDREPGQQWGQSAPGQAQGGRAWSDAGGPNRAPIADARSLGGDQSHAAAECGSEGPDGTGLAVERGVDHRTEWGVFAPAIARWERITGYPAPRPVVPTGRAGRNRLNPALPEWMMGLAPGHITDVPGLAWKDQLKAAGNGVVSQQAVMAYRYLLEISRLAA